MASIKPDPTGSNGGSISRSGGRITIDNTSLRDIIAFAYDVPADRAYQLLAPGWMDGAKFDIAATFPAETSRADLRTMLRALLESRFGVKTHYEERSVRTYALVVSPQGPKVKEHTGPDDGAFIYGSDHITGRAVSMSGLADKLSSPYFRLDRPVMDDTGITGYWDFELRWTPDSAAGTDASAPSIFTALQEQLGLRLIARTAPVRVLVVDHAEREPTAN